MHVSCKWSWSLSWHCHVDLASERRSYTHYSSRYSKPALSVAVRPYPGRKQTCRPRSSRKPFVDTWWRTGSTRWTCGSNSSPMLPSRTDIRPWKRIWRNHKVDHTMLSLKDASCCKSSERSESLRRNDEIWETPWRAESPPVNIQHTPTQNTRNSLKLKIPTSQQATHTSVSDVVVLVSAVFPWTPCTWGSAKNLHSLRFWPSSSLAAKRKGRCGKFGFSSTRGHCICPPNPGEATFHLKSVPTLSPSLVH